MIVGRCPKCGAERPSGATECPNCGVVYARAEQSRVRRAVKDLEESAAAQAAEAKSPFRTCPGCGGKVSKKIRNCPKCGYNFGYAEPDVGGGGRNWGGLVRKLLGLAVVVAIAYGAYAYQDELKGLLGQFAPSGKKGGTPENAAIVGSPYGCRQLNAYKKLVKAEQGGDTAAFENLMGEYQGSGECRYMSPGSVKVESNRLTDNAVRVRPAGDGDGWWVARSALQ